jgi:hypothetical protein
MKLRAFVFILLAFVLFLGLTALALAQGGDPEYDQLTFLPIVTLNSSEFVGPPVLCPPLIFSLDGSSVDAGSDLRVKLEYHTPQQRYDVYLYSVSLGYVRICSDLDTDAFGMDVARCNVPTDTTPGTYQLVTILAGGDTDPANHVAEGDLVHVLYPVITSTVLEVVPVETVNQGGNR